MHRASKMNREDEDRWKLVLSERFFSATFDRFSFFLFSISTYDWLLTLPAPLLMVDIFRCEMVPRELEIGFYNFLLGGGYVLDYRYGSKGEI